MWPSRHLPLENPSISQYHTEPCRLSAPHPPDPRDAGPGAVRRPVPPLTCAIGGVATAAGEGNDALRPPAPPHARTMDALLLAMLVATATTASLARSHRPFPTADSAIRCGAAAAEPPPPAIQSVASGEGGKPSARERAGLASRLRLREFLFRLLSAAVRASAEPTRRVGEGNPRQERGGRR